MKVGLKYQTKAKSDSLDNAIGELVKTIKRDLLKKHGRVNYAELRKSGYSNILLTRLRRV